MKFPDKLYGRETEKEVLEKALECACEGQAVTVVVSGSPGIGKTMLINQTLKPLILGKSYFISGKFDQLEHNIPYAPFSTAFASLIKQLMTESPEKLDWWKKRILKSLGKSGRVITDIIPELEWIIGKQPPVDPLPPKEAENRLRLIFRDFVSIFAWEGHPLVLFLDDLQWADYASLNLLKYLTQDAKLNSLFFIGAYRDNEVADDHPLIKLLITDLKASSGKNLISLKSLKRGEIEKLVAETLNKDPKDITALSEALYRLSGGNPFFLKQLLMMLVDEKILYFNNRDGGWVWEFETIQNLQPGKDVIRLILKKIHRLPEETRELLNLASCIGNTFELETISAVSGKPMEDIVTCLMPSVLEGLILKGEIDQKTNLASDSKPDSTLFEFLHDRVQQAVYSTIPEYEKMKKHLKIGRFMLKKNRGTEERILSVMDHFNRSLELVHDQDERMQLVEYNLLAGRRAKASAAYSSALQYFRYAIELLPDNAWDQIYELSYEIHLELAQAEYLSGNIETAEKLFDNVIKKARDELQKASVYGLKVILYAGIGKYTEAIMTGIKALGNLGVRLPTKPSVLDYAKELLQYKWYMRNKKIEDLMALTEMKKPKHIKISELLTRLCYVTITAHPNLYSFIILKAGNHAVKYGNNETAAVGYLGYGITSGSILGDYEAGDRYGRVSIDLAEKYNRSYTKCNVYFVMGAFISHWVRHAFYSLDYLEKAASHGVEAGDVLIIGFAHCVLLETCYLQGISLEKISEYVHEKQEIARRLKHDNLAINGVMYEEVVAVLQGKRADSIVSAVAELEKDELLKLVKKDQCSLATYYCLRMQLNYMSGNYQVALKSGKKVEPLVGALLGFLISAEYHFYYSLSITASFDQLPAKERRYFWKRLNKNLRQMRKWAKSCQDNFEHKYLLIAAELARLQKKKEEAMSLYDQAIRSAQKSSYIQNEALANELAAKFYLSQGLRKISKVYMLDAYEGYSKWGAFAKAKELQDRYPELLEGISNTRQESQSVKTIENILRVTTPSEMEVASSMDMYFVDKAVENISKETDINNLFDSFLDIAVQTVGADKGCLILEKDGELFVEAIKTGSLSDASIKTVTLEECGEVSKAVIRYVARTLETVVLNDREPSEIFAGDSYISKTNPGSIACIPLLFQGIPFGVLYLENSFIPGAFAPDRLETLKLLSGQVAYASKLKTYLEEDDKPKEEKDPDFFEPLTERETEVIKLIADGLSNKEIGKRLEMTVNTVKTHIRNIYGKLQVNRRVQAVERARKLGIL